MKKVLLVDDSDTIRDQLKEVFAGINDIEVKEAENGLVGLQALEENPDVKLIILDVNMPEMDGISMLRRISDEGKHTSIPVVMLTTEASKQLKEEAKKNGARAWILKPFNKEKIELVVKKLLS